MSVKNIVLGAGAYSAGKPLTVSYIGYTTYSSTPAAGTTVTVPSVYLGPAGTGRRVYLVVVNDADRNLTGVAYTGLVSYDLTSSLTEPGTGTPPRCRVAYADEASATTRNIEFTFSGSGVSKVGVIVYNVYGHTTSGASALVVTNTYTNASNVSNFTLTQTRSSPGGFTLSALFGRSYAGTVTVLGKTPDTGTATIQVGTTDPIYFSTYADNPTSAYVKNYNWYWTGAGAEAVLMPVFKV